MKRGTICPTGYKQKVFAAAVTAAVGMLAWFAYEWGPRVFNFDDGPYFSVPFEREVNELPLQSRVDLRRFGRLAFTLESRVLDDPEKGSVLVLREPDGTVRWKRVPIKHDGPLGAMALIQTHTSATWSGGWEVAIKPAAQENGSLYIGPLGGFRFFYHSW